MTTTGYTFIGWVVWQLGSRVAMKKIAENRVKLGAAGVVAARAGRRRRGSRRPPAPTTEASRRDPALAAGVE